jgi:hypothetical protein
MIDTNRQRQSGKHVKTTVFWSPLRLIFDFHCYSRETMETPQVKPLKPDSFAPAGCEGQI